MPTLWTMESAEVEKPFVVRYACRKDNGSLQPRYRWVRGEDGAVSIEFPGLQVLYCWSCQFRYGQPGCLVCAEAPRCVVRVDGWEAEDAEE